MLTPLKVLFFCIKNRLIDIRVYCALRLPLQTVHFCIKPREAFTFTVSGSADGH